MKKSFALKALAGMTLLAASAPSFAGLTGNINVVSAYILRGITETYNSTYDNSGPESDEPALQGGIDYAHDSGLYAGYWFSTIGYSYANLQPESQRTKKYKNSIEHDFYAGYNGKIGDLGYTLGGTFYYYEPGWHSTAFETKLGVSYGPVSLTAQTLLDDVTFGNAGDTYFLGTFTQPLPSDFTFTGQVGYYIYDTNGRDIPKADTSKSSAFRHVTLGLSHPLPLKGATMGLQYIVGGENRFGLNQDNTLVGSVGFTF